MAPGKGSFDFLRGSKRPFERVALWPFEEPKLSLERGRNDPSEG